MCETKEVIVSLSLILIGAASFSKNIAHTKENVGHFSHLKSQGPCEREYIIIVRTVANTII